MLQEERQDPSMETSVRQVRLQKRLESLRKKNNTLRQSNIRLLNKLKQQRKAKPNKEQIEIFLKELPPDLAEIVKCNMPNKKKHGQRYSNNMKRPCIRIHSYSPKTYRLLRKMFRLPSEMTLRRSTRNWECKSGINEMFFKGMKQALEDHVELRPGYKYCILCIDEVKINPHLNYNARNDEVLGIANFKVDGKAQIGTHATVILVRGLFDNYKQPILYWIVKDSIKAKDLKTVVGPCIEKLYECGFEVKGMVSDMGTNFQSFARQMKVTSQTPYFFVNGNKIYYFFDTPHLLKATRNCLLKYNITVGTEGEASWEHISNLYENEKDQRFKLAPKLKEEHIYPNSLQKMRVKYAAQALSGTVAAALANAVHYQGASETVLVTAKFVQTFNDLFDVLNSSTENNDEIPHKSAFKGDDWQIELLNNGAKYISNLTVKHNGKNVTSRFCFLKSWPVTISALISLWNDIRADETVTYLMTRRINQDPLENFFGLMRNTCGNNRRPTSEQFIAGFKMQLYQPFLEERSVTAVGNCEPDVDDFLFTPNDAIPFELPNGGILPNPEENGG